jgi:hypothetical protein
MPNRRKARRFKGSLASILAFCLLIPVTAGRIEAAWDDQSGNLPGISSAKSAIVWGAAIGGGVVLAAFLLKKKGDRRNPKLEVRPSKLDYGPIAKGEDSRQQFMVRNTANSRVTIQTIAVSGEAFHFSPQPAFPVTLEPGESASMPISFAPPSKGKFSGRVEVLAEANSGKFKKWTISLKGKAL